MTISQFAREVFGDASVGKNGGPNSGVARAYRDRRFQDACRRQVLHDEDVARVMREQNVSEVEARRVVSLRKRLERKRAQRVTRRARG